MKISEVIEPSNLNEGWKENLARLALIGSVGLSGLTGYEMKKSYDSYNDNQKTTSVIEPQKPASHVEVKTDDKLSSIRPQPKPEVASELALKTSPRPQQAPTTSEMGKEVNYLIDLAVESGIVGIELAAFLAQVSVETNEFKTMEEAGSSSYFKKYEKGDLAKILGNKKVGDGERFKGRGPLQLTGRYNYSIAGKAIGVNLIKHPELVADSKIGAKIAIWFWKKRVSSKVENFNDTKAITYYINGGTSALSERESKFQFFKNILKKEGVI